MPVDTRKRPREQGFRPDRGLMVSTGLLFAVTFALGYFGISAGRPLFILGSAVLGWRAWKLGPTQHVALMITLFAFAPFLRRVVDLSCGFDDAGIMLSGPLIALLPPSIDLLRLQKPTGQSLSIWPYCLVGACAGYSLLISVFSGQFDEVWGLALKWGAPLIYGIYVLNAQRQGHDLLGATSKAFLLTMPIVGLYGISQYLDPPQWDRVWMVFSKMESIGNPLPFQVRVFSTMNSPASCAVYLATGIILLWLRRDLRVSTLAAVPMTATLLLSLYRTAWISLAGGILLCGAYQATRKRTLVIVVCLAATAVIALGTGQAGDQLTNRFSSFSEGGNDGSARMRMSEFASFYERADHLLVGWGGVSLRAPNAFGLLDGTVIQVMVGMGLFVGPICLITLVWIAIRALFDARNFGSTEAVVVRALVLGEILQMPLGNVTNGELGFLFWLVVGIATGRSKKPAFGAHGFANRLPPSHYPVTTAN